MNRVLMQVLDGLERMGPAIVAAATVVLAILTGVYVWLTKRLVDASRDAREPLVGLDFEMPNHSMRMVVANHGPAAAKNVEIRVVKDVSWLKNDDDEGFSKTSVATDGISYLGPGRRLLYYVGPPRWKDTPDEEMLAVFEVAYENMDGRPFASRVEFNFAQMRDVLFESYRDPVKEIAAAIEEAARRLKDPGLEGMAKRFASAQKRGCPYCTELIGIRASKCPHCHEAVEPKEPATQQAAPADPHSEGG